MPTALFYTSLECPAGRGIILNFLELPLKKALMDDGLIDGLMLAHASSSSLQQGWFVMTHE